MLRDEILSQKSFSPSASSLLTGQTIKESEITNLSSYKLMNEEEREIVGSILDGMRPKEQGIERGMALTKRMDSLVPRTEEVVFKDAS